VRDSWETERRAGGRWWEAIHFPGFGWDEGNGRWLVMGPWDKMGMMFGAWLMKW